MPARPAQHASENRATPLFSEGETSWLQQSFERFSDKLSCSQDWSFHILKVLKTFAASATAPSLSLSLTSQRTSERGGVSP